MTTSYSATYFDGRSGAGEIVVVALEGDVLRVASRKRILRYRLADVRIAESFANAPTMIALPEGGTLEVRDPARTFGAALAAAGRRVSPIVRLQRHWPAALASLALLIAVLAWAYVAGLPIVARAAVDAMPASLERRMGASVLEAMDARTLQATKLPAERRARIASAFAAAAARSAPEVAVRLEFRAGSANAFALPGGIVVLFDDLVGLARSDEELLGVLGHELGHVVHRHSTRQLVQALGVAAVASLLWGDFSSVAANAPVLLGVFRYGRDFEREADDYAIAFLRANGLPVAPFDDLLVRLAKRKGAGDGLPDFLSTHPATSERRQRLREAAAADGARRVAGSDPDGAEPSDDGAGEPAPAADAQPSR